MTQVVVTPLPGDFYHIYFFCLYLAFQLALYAVWGRFGFLPHFHTASSMAGQALLDSLAINYEEIPLSCM